VPRSFFCYPSDCSRGIRLMALWGLANPSAHLVAAMLLGFAIIVALRVTKAEQVARSS
jgi:hypothetical protein